MVGGRMAFFRKLKDKLFKSSSKLDEGLEAIVADGGEEEAVEEVEAVEAGALVTEAAVAEPGASSEPVPGAPPWRAGERFGRRVVTCAGAAASIT